MTRDELVRSIAGILADGYPDPMEQERTAAEEIVVWLERHGGPLPTPAPGLAQSGPLLRDVLRAGCASCVFYQPGWTGAPRGECRREAPVFRPTDTEGEGAWPTVSGTSWCGKFQPNDSW